MSDKDMSDKERIRVMLVDYHAVVRSGLSAFLMTYEDLELVGEASDGEEAIVEANRIRPDVILMDLVMPRADGATAIRARRDQNPDVQMIALTSFKEQDLVQQALRAGAIGYLLKDVSADELADAIRAAHAGRPTLAPEAAEALIRNVRNGESNALGHDLTDRDARGPRTHGRRSEQQRNLRAPHRQPFHRQIPRQQYPLEARRFQPHRSRRHRSPTRSHLPNLAAPSRLSNIAALSRHQPSPSHLTSTKTPLQSGSSADHVHGASSRPSVYTREQRGRRSPLAVRPADPARAPRRTVKAP